MRRKKSANVPKKKSASKKLLKSLRLQSRVDSLEAQFKSFLEHKRDETNFQAGLMFGLNGIVEALVGKDVLTLQEIEASRVKVMADYRQEKLNQLEREATSKKYKGDPIHYDTTLDKWFVFAPNWKDKVGPFMSREAAEEAQRQIEQPYRVAEPVPVEPVPVEPVPVEPVPVEPVPVEPVPVEPVPVEPVPEEVVEGP